MAIAVEPIQPPRTTGDPRADYAALIDYLWQFYRVVVRNYLNTSDVGDTVQPSSLMLDVLSELTPEADKFPYTTGASSAAMATVTPFARTLLDDSSAVNFRATLGLGALSLLSTLSTGYIDNDAVTYEKIQNVTTNNVLLGRATAGAGIVEEITIGTNLSLVGTTLSATSGSSFDHLSFIESPTDFGGF